MLNQSVSQEEFGMEFHKRQQNVYRDYFRTESGKQSVHKRHGCREEQRMVKIRKIFSKT